MEALKLEFKMNDMNYKIVERSDSRYFAELHSTESGNLVAYETGRIVQRKGNTGIIAGKAVEFKAKEAIINNEQFGKCPSGLEMCMTPKNKQEVYNTYLEAIKWDRKNSK